MQTLSSRWLVAIGAVVVGLILVSVVVAIVNPRGAADTLPEDTPEGIVQRFILAVQDSDYSLAHSYLTEEMKETCPLTNIEEGIHRLKDRSEDQRIALLDTDELSGGRVQVRVRVTTLNVSPPFGVDEYSRQERYILVQEDGNWRLAEPAWPVGLCPSLKRAPAAIPAD